MQNKLLIVLVIVIGLLALWQVFSKKLDGRQSSIATARVPEPQNRSPTPAAVGQQATLPANPSPPIVFGAQKRGFILAFQTPIAFYGRVIDQHGNPVPNADVKLSANDKAFGGSPSHYTRTTDVDGRFSILDARGITLGVEVSKSGYRGIPPVYGKVTSSGLFEYGLSSRGTYQSSKDSPTIFTLHRIGVVEPLVKIGEKNFPMARDGTPLSIAVDEQGAHQVVLRCWNQELQRPAGQQHYDWRLEISVPSGGLLARKDAFAFAAPADGYARDDTINMPASLPSGHGGWDSFAERSYFIHFNDGTFARANLRMRAGGDHFVVWESFFNPKIGSRNLESIPENQSASR